MTNIEAKKQIVAYIYFAFDDIPEDVGKALDRAIKALDFIEENYPKTFEDYLNGDQI